MSDPFVVEVVRSGSVESSHLVDVAVVDEVGDLVAAAGDPDVRAAYRSSAKPIQARAALEAGWVPADERALAIACASHNGEDEHLKAVRAVLSTAGLEETALRCPPDVPLSLDAARAVKERAPIFHNCSGKHAGMLAACVAAAWPLESYRAPDHPLQVRVRDLMESLVGPMEGPLVDGCGVPTFSASLGALARGFLRIDGGAEAVAMRAHPFLVGGTGRLDTDLMTVAPSILTKGGAEGLVCLSGGGFGIAVKSRDGAARPRGPVVLAVLYELGLIGDAELDALPAHREPAVLGGGEPVGGLRARGSLVRQ
jgi:L-asparaginase II